MKCIKTSLIAGVAAMTIAAPAGAADMPLPVYKAPVAVQTGGWYLRGDIGMTNQSVGELTSPAYTPDVTVLQKDVSSGMLGGLGLGYQFNNWFRADVTGEYRGNSQFFGTDRITYAGGVGTDTYHATKNEWVVLGNAYVDLGTWWCITPFIGAGVGGARVAINGFTDQGIANNGGGALPGLAYGDSVAKWNFAWAAHAGLAYKVTPNFTVELAYRYLDMGDGMTGDLRTFDGVNGIYNPMTFKNITSHDLKLGVRWDLTSPAVYAPPPLIRKG
jgi:opacity protein-like surface antigen